MFLLSLLFISIFNIFKDKRPYSLNKTYWYFTLIFFFIAPFIQYLLNYDVWGYRFHITDKYYLKTNIYIIIGLLIHQITYGKIEKKLNFIINDNKEKPNYKWILLGISIVCLLILGVNVGFSNLFARSTNASELSDNSMFNTIFTCLLKVIPVYVFTYLYNRSGKLDLCQFLNLIIIFIVNFPISTTRFWMGAIFIGIFLITFVKNKKRSRVYDIILISIFTVIFPITYSFKFNTIDTIIENGIEFQNLASSYDSVDYDAYSIFARSIEFVDENNFVYGKQLIGTVLFFIPRSVWPTKPKATGAFIAEQQYQRYTNISCPFMAEGVVNFGILGLIIFELLLSLVCKKLDNNFWGSNRNKYLSLLYPYLIGLLLFYERGALHHAVVYTFCFSLPAIFIWIKNTLFFKKKETIYVK